MRSFRTFAKSIVISGLMIAGIASAVAQTGPVLFATDGRECTPSTLYQLDPADGSIISTIGATGVSGMTSLASHPLTGVMYGITTGGGDGACTNSLYTINLTTGVATLVGATGIPGGKPDAAFRADGTLFTYATRDDNLYTVNLGTGALSLVGDTTVSAWDISLAFDAGVLVMTNGDTIFTVNTSTGLATSVTALGTDVNDSNMSTTHPYTGQVYLGDSDNYSQFDLYTLNTTTGDMTLLGSNDVYQMSAIEFESGGVASDDVIGPFNPIPTLANWGLLLLSGCLGLLAFIALRRRA